MVLDDAEVERLNSRLRFDAVLAGTGVRSEGGRIDIEAVVHLRGLPTAFVADYPQVANADAVGRLFAERPGLVQTVRVSDYPRTPNRAGGLVAAYLSRYGIRHLLLAGLESSFGLAWMTFYRLQNDQRFDPADAEFAQYEVPTVLYRWQCANRNRLRIAATHGLLPLTPREIQVAMLNARGQAPKDIARQLGLSVHYVRDLIQGSRVKLGITGRRMTLDDLASKDSPAD